MSKEIARLKQIEEWLADGFEKWLAVTEDPIELKKGSDAIVVVRQWAVRRHYDRELCNRMFHAGTRVDRKRGAWIRENIRHEGGRKTINGDDSFYLSDIETSLNESSYCQRLLTFTEQQILGYQQRCNQKDEWCSKGGLKRLGMGPKDDDEYEQPDLPQGIFQVIYADPPWQYKNSGFDNSSMGQYRTMPTSEIMSWGPSILEITSDLSVLFLWAVNPMLNDALAVLRSWGFEYKTNIAWVKDKPRGRGWFLIAQHELLLIGVKPKTLKPAQRVPSVILADRGEIHSRKPIEVFEQIEKMYPVNLNQEIHLELFAREGKRPGWIHHGDEL